MAWSIWDGMELISYGSTVDMGDLISKIEESGRVYCEDQFPGKSWESMKKLIRATGWVECIAKLAGKPFVLINPRTWKSHYGLNKKLHKTLLWKMKCGAAEEYISEMYLIKAREDVIDAVLMGAWGQWSLSQGQSENAPSPAPDTGANGAASTSRKRGSNTTIKSRTRK